MERDLVVRAQRGDEHAFAELAFAMGDRLYAVAHRILRDGDLAADATQQTLVTIWRELPALRDPGRFSAWAFRLLVNASYRETRRTRLLRRNVHLLHREDAEDPSAAVEVRDELERAFRRLSPDHRAVLVLQFHLGQSMEEIAETLGIPIGTVRSRIHHAKRHLRAALEADARQAIGGRRA
jgi:RNA polymerase sigma-70 factor (ECF subfamily)